jgi:hypothetical protein
MRPPVSARGCAFIPIPIAAVASRRTSRDTAVTIHLARRIAGESARGDGKTSAEADARAPVTKRASADF